MIKSEAMDGAEARAKIISGDAPDKLFVRSLDLSKVQTSFRLPSHLTCYDLDISSSSIESIPGTIRVLGRLNLADCSQLLELPEGLQVGTLILRNCVCLESLPERLSVSFLDASGCVSLCNIPESVSITIGSLNLRNARSLERLPCLGPLTSLNIAGCTGITRLPEGMVVTSWLDIGGSSLKELPASLKEVPLRWRSVRIDERIAFRPETLKPDEILTESNIERRRIMLERVGYERFFDLVQAEVLDRDTDPGGERKLMQIPIPNDESLVCVSVFCPSTGRRYIIRVPPTIRSCRHAVAWTAGFDNADDYNPVAET